MQLTVALWGGWGVNFVADFGVAGFRGSVCLALRDGMPIAQGMVS